MRTKGPCVAVYGISTLPVPHVVKFDSMAECRAHVKRSKWAWDYKLRWITIVPKSGVPEQVKC